jgi:hypothetical protein
MVGNRYYKLYYKIYQKMIKFLNLDYLDQCANLHQTKNKIAGTSPVGVSIFREKFLPYFEQRENYFSLGYFDQNKLISWISIMFHENQMRGKFWTISCLYTSKPHNIFSIDRPEIGPLIKSAQKFAESKKYYTYFYAISEKVSKVYEIKWRKNKLVKPGRYNLIDLDIVPPNTVPKFELYWRLMGEEIKPDPIMIKKRVLKEEYYNKPLI